MLWIGLSACQQPVEQIAYADTVLRGGVIHTVNADQPRAEAIALTASRVVFVGSNSEGSAHVGPHTEVVDLDGRLVLPGIVDAHLHPLGGATQELYQCKFPFSANPEEIQAVVADCLAAQPDAEWITGGQWDSGFFERFEMTSPRSLLDEVSSEVAIFLNDDSVHNAWVNSKALELAGITAETPDPIGGTIEREADGSPNGVLLESAVDPVYALIPANSESQFLEAAKWFSNYANAFGITAVKAAAIEEDELIGFRMTDNSGELTIHVAGAIRTPTGHRTTPLDYDEIDRIRDAYASEHVHTEFVKIFLDGVPTPARTAAMLNPYLPDDAHGDDFTGGDLHVGLETLAADLIELDRRGYTVKMHTAGDRSVRIALDAIQMARDALGDNEKRHELAHAGYVHADDLPRFAELNAVADFCPTLWYPSPIIDAVLSAVGRERGEHYWPTRDLLDAKAPILAGSDWPSAVPDANPWPAIEAFVTRRDPRGDIEGTLWPEQAITLEEAVEIFTLHGARAMKMQDRIGTIEVGKLADFIVLDRNIFEIPIDEVGETQVEQTYFEGARVYQQSSGHL